MTTQPTTTLQSLFDAGIEPFYAWIKKLAEETPMRTFLEGDAEENPVSAYVSAHLDNQQVIRYGVHLLTMTDGGIQLPHDFLAFFRIYHNAFKEGYPTAAQLQEWIGLGMQAEYSYDDQYHEKVMKAIDDLVALLRTGTNLDPEQATKEEMFGSAIARYCHWEPEKIAKVLRLCFCAIEAANMATLENILIDYFGEETFQ